MTNTNTALQVGDRVKVVKGCMARGITRTARAVVREVRPLGPDYSHAVLVSFMFSTGTFAGRVVNLYARHLNRLSDEIINLNDGNPLHTIQITRAR